MGKINDFGFPFTSVTGDRQYSASEWRDYFESLLTNGVVVEILNTLKVNPQAVANKTIYVDTGSIVINGCMRILDTTQNITIADNTSGNPRVDRIVARLNYTDRKIEFAVLTGTPAGSPVAPTLTQNTTVWELSLAQIAVANGFSTIIVGNITDERTYMQYNVEPYTSDKYFGKLSQMSGGSAIAGSQTNLLVGFSTEDFDDFNAIDLITSTTKIIVPTGATRIKISTTASLSVSNVSSTASIGLFKNNVSISTILTAYINAIENTAISGKYCNNIVLAVIAGDYFELKATTTSNATVGAGTIFKMEVLA